MGAARRPSPLGPAFRRLWAANAFANLGDGIAFVGIPLLAAALTSDPLLIAGLSVVHSVVRLVVVLPIGGLVDRWDRRTVLWAANLSRAVLVAALAVLVGTSGAGIAVLYVMFALIGITETAVDNAALSILPNLVSVRDLDRANGQITATQLVADEFAGPPLGGVLFAAAAALPFAVTGSAYGAAAVLIFSLRGAFRPGDVVARTAGAVPAPARRPEPLRREVLDGVVWVRGNRLFASLAGLSALTSIAYMAPFSVLVLYSQQVLGQTTTEYGVLLAVSAGGGLIGTAITPALRRVWGYARTIAASLLLGSLSLAGLAVTTHGLFAGALLATYILHAVVWGICVTSLRQRLVPDELRGRVNAVTKLLGLCGLVVGGLVGGLLGRFDVALPFAAGAGLFLVAASWAWTAVRAWERSARQPA